MSSPYRGEPPVQADPQEGRPPFALLGRLFARLPQFPPTAVSALVMNLLLREVLGSPQLEPVRGKLVRVQVTDLGLTLSYRVRHTGLAATGEEAPDVTIIADSAGLWSLVTGREDADMLFFSRRLVMTGDTELGLLIRNTLDAIDRKEVLRARLPMPGEVLRAVRETLDVPCGAITRAIRRPRAQ